MKRSTLLVLACVLTAAGTADAACAPIDLPARTDGRIVLEFRRAASCVTNGAAPRLDCHVGTPTVFSCGLAPAKAGDFAVTGGDAREAALITTVDPKSGAWLVSYQPKEYVLRRLHGGETVRRAAAAVERGGNAWNRLEIVRTGTDVKHVLNGREVFRGSVAAADGGRAELFDPDGTLEVRRFSREALPREYGPETVCDTLYAKPDRLPLVISGESRAEAVANSEYCLYADVFYADGSKDYAIRANFRSGTHGWERSNVVLVPKKPIVRVRLNALCRKGTGRAFFRNVTLERREGRGEAVGVLRRTDRPHSAADRIEMDVFRRRELFPVTFTVPSTGDRTFASPVPQGRAVVWTAEAMRLVTPLTFPTDGEAAAPAIDLELAKGERESAQVLVSTAEDVEWRSGGLTCSALTNAAGQTLAACTWERQGYLARVRGYDPHPNAFPNDERWFPDPLLPAAPFRVRAGSTQGLWLTFAAPRTAAAGVYRGVVRVTEAGRNVRTVPVTLRVRDFALPETFGLVTAFTLMDGFMRARYPADWRRRFREAADILLDHRLNPDDITRTSPPAVEDLLHYRSRGMNSFNILNIVPEPPAGSTAKWTSIARPEEIFTPEFFAAFTARVRPYYEELKRHGLEKMAYVYGFDERQSEYYAGIEKFWKDFKREFPDLPVVTTAKMYADMQMGRTNLPSLVSCDVYCPCTYRWTEPINRRLRARGMKLWWYTCCGPRHPYANMASYEHPLVEGRLLLGAMTYHFGADAFLFWHVNNWNEHHQATLDASDTFFPDWDTYSHLRCPGDGVFLYPAADRVLPSIRLAQIRDGVEDCEWFRLAEAKVGRQAVDAIVGKLCPSLTEFTRDPAALRRARRAVGDLLCVSVNVESRQSSHQKGE